MGVVCCLSKRSVREAEPTNTHPSVNLQSLQSFKMSLPLGGVGGVKREDAVKFLERVQQRLNSRPQDYADFLNIMKELQSESLPVESAIEEIKNIFKVHNICNFGAVTFWVLNLWGNF